MARFRRVRRIGRRLRSAGRRIGKAARKIGVGDSSRLIQIDAMAYGGLRQYMSGMISPYASQLPVVGALGSYVDEAAMGLLCWAGVKYGSGLIRDIARKGLVIENARVGEGLASGLLPGASGTPTAQSPNYG